MVSRASALLCHVLSLAVLAAAHGVDPDVRPQAKQEHPNVIWIMADDMVVALSRGTHPACHWRQRFHLFGGSPAAPRFSN